jgi:DNA-directed RNA polymerase specialized sigma subunit
MSEVKTDKISAKRICIYPKDIQLLTGKSLRYSQKLISQARKHFSKEKNQLLTIREFCDYMGLEEEEVRNSILFEKFYKIFSFPIICKSVDCANVLPMFNLS